MFVNKYPTQMIMVFILLGAGLLYGVTAPLFTNPVLGLAALGGGLFVLVAFVKPIVGLYLFVIAMFIEGVSLTVGSGITFAKLVGMLAFVAWLAHSLMSGNFQIEIPGPGQLLVIFVIWGGLSALWALEAGLVLERMQILIQSLALYVVVVNLVNSDRCLWNLIYIVIVMSVLVSFLILYRILSGMMIAGRVDVTSISALDPNEQAAYLLPGVAVIMSLIGLERQVSKRILYMVAFSVIVLAVLVTYSRGAIVSLGAMLALGLTLDRRSWQLLPLALLVGGVALVLLPPTFLDRVESIFVLSARGAGRLDIWLVGFQIIKTHPVLGVGLGNFGEAFSRYFPHTPGIRRVFEQGMGPHNIFVGVFGELGLVGLFIFFIVIGLTIVRFAKQMYTSVEHKKGLRDDVLMRGMFVGVFGLLVASMFVDLRYRKLFWFFMALVEVPRRLHLFQEDSS